MRGAGLVGIPLCCNRGSIILSSMFPAGYFECPLQLVERLEILSKSLKVFMAIEKAKDLHRADATSLRVTAAHAFHL